MTVGLPPAWVDIAEELTANIQRARIKMAELVKAQSKALMPSFGDGRDDQRQIEGLSQEITDILRRSEKRLKELSARGPSEDSGVRTNVQVGVCSTTLTSLHTPFISCCSSSFVYQVLSFFFLFMLCTFLCLSLIHI